MPAVHLLGCITLFVFLFLAFGVGSFDLPVTATVEGLSVSSLSFRRFLCVKIPGEAVCAKMLFWHLLAMVVALNVLPGIAFWTVDGIAIIIFIDAYTFDGVFLLILEIGVGKRAVW